MSGTFAPAAIGISSVRYWAKICAAACSFGRSILIFTSSRPGRRIAGSMRSSRFVAPITITLRSPSTPSISASSCGTIVDSMSELMPEPRGAEHRVHLVEEHDDRPALLALFPGALEHEADLALRLADVLVEQLRALDVDEVAAPFSPPVVAATFFAREFATAFAMSVLPQPGGPYRRMPFGAGSWCSANRSAWRNGSSTASAICSIWSSRPPMSS
jgi:hypothetical protein